MLLRTTKGNSEGIIIPEQRRSPACAPPDDAAGQKISPIKAHSAKKTDMKNENLVVTPHTTFELLNCMCGQGRIFLFSQYC